MTKKSGLICIDWDGTLLSSDDLITKCIKKTLIHMKIPIPDRVILTRLSGESEERIMQVCLRDHMQYSKDFWPIFRTIYNKKTLELTHGAIEFLLRHQHFNLCIVTNKNAEAIHSEVQHFNLMQWIDMIYSADRYVAKPDPAMILQAMDDVDCEPEKTWMIGDSIADSLAAENAKVSFIPVNASHWREDFSLLQDINISYS